MSYKKVEEYCDDELEKMAKNNKEILKLIGEDPDREGLVKHQCALQRQYNL